MYSTEELQKKFTTSLVSLHCLVKQKQRKQHILSQLDHYGILLLHNLNESVSYLKCSFTASVQKADILNL